MTNHLSEERIREIDNEYRSDMKTGIESDSIVPYINKALAEERELIADWLENHTIGCNEAEISLFKGAATQLRNKP